MPASPTPSACASARRSRSSPRSAASCASAWSGSCGRCKPKAGWRTCIPARSAAAGLALDGPLAVRLDPGADEDRVRAALTALGAETRTVGGATGSNRELLALLARLLRLVAVTVALVCLATLIQALALAATERSGAVATLRAAGADGRALRRLLAGSALAVSVPAALFALGLERLALAPLVERADRGLRRSAAADRARAGRHRDPRSRADGRRRERVDEQTTRAPARRSRAARGRGLTVAGAGW